MIKVCCKDFRDSLVQQLCLSSEFNTSYLLDARRWEKYIDVHDTQYGYAYSICFEPSFWAMFVSVSMYRHGLKTTESTVIGDKQFNLADISEICGWVLDVLKTERQTTQYRYTTGL